MTKANERRPTQGGQTKNYVLQPIPTDEVPAGQTMKDLGTKWGLEGNQTLRKTRSGAQLRSIPGGLEPAQDEQEPRSISLHHKFCLGRILAGVIALVSVRMIPWVPAGFDVGPTP